MHQLFSQLISLCYHCHNLSHNIFIQLTSLSITFLPQILSFFFYNFNVVKNDVIFRHALARHSIELTLLDSSRNYDRIRGTVVSVSKVHRGVLRVSVNPLCGHGSVVTHRFDVSLYPIQHEASRVIVICGQARGTSLIQYPSNKTLFQNWLCAI